MADETETGEEERELREDGSLKPLNGNQKRIKALAKKNAALLSETGGGEAYDSLGDPDLEDPTSALEYVRRAQLIAFSQICKSRALPQLERWRLIKEMSAVVGMTHNRAALETRTKKLEQMLKDKKQAGSIRIEHGSNVKRPPTARGLWKGPRPVTDETKTEEKKDE